MTHIAQHEWRLVRRDGTAMLVLSGLVLLSILGAWNGARWSLGLERAKANVQADEARRLHSLGGQMDRAWRGAAFPPTQDPRLPSYVGSTAGLHAAAMPGMPLSALSTGQSDLLPWHYRVSTRAWQTLHNTDEIDNPMHLLAGRFDLAFVLAWLYPLLAIAVAYDLLSGEKESGTLGLAMSQPVSLIGWLIPRAAVRLSLVLIPAASISIVAGLLTGGTAAFAALVPWLAALALYGVFWVALACVVNGRGLGSAASAMTLFGCWLLLVVIAPAAIGIAAASLYPVPSRIEMIEAVRNATNEANHRSSLLLARYYDDHPELAPAGEANAATEFATRSLAVQTEVERRIAPLLDRYDAQLEQQQELASRLRFLSPATALADAMNQLAGTSSERYRDFTAQVRRFHREWQAWFAPHIFKRAMLHSDDVARLPRFRYQPWSDGGRVLADLAGLAIVAAVVAGLAVWQLRRYAIVG